MLLITFGLTTPFIFATEATMSFFKQNAFRLQRYNLNIYESP